MFKYLKLSVIFAEKYINLFNNFSLNIAKYNSINNSIEKIKKLNNKEILHNLENEKLSLISKTQDFNIPFTYFVIDELKNFKLKLASFCFDFMILGFENNIKYYKEEKNVDIEKAFLHNLIKVDNSSHICYLPIKDNKYVENNFFTDEIPSHFKIVNFIKIQNPFSILYNSLFNCINNKIAINKCKNCKQFFITVNRTDEKYCSNPSPQNKQKTCKEYGAKKFFREKLESDKIRKAHELTSQFFRMRIKRCSNEKNKQKIITKFEKYKKQYQTNIKKYRNNKISEKDFANWIIEQKK